MMKQRSNNVPVQAVQVGICFWSRKDFQICSVQLQSVDGSAMKNVSMKIVAPSLKSAQLTKHNGSLC